MIRSTLEAYGRIDVLVNNAGVNFVKPFDLTEPADWDRVVNTDLRGTYLCSRLAILEMLKSGGGSVTNIATVHALACLPNAAPYDAAKWGMVGLTKSLAVEYADRHIRVNTIAPSFFETQMVTRNSNPDLEAMFKKRLELVPMHRMGKPSELVAAIVFLASPGAGMVTGTVLPIDGGYLAQ